MVGTGSMEIDDEEQKDTPVFEKHDHMLHGKEKRYSRNVGVVSRLYFFVTIEK